MTWISLNRIESIANALIEGIFETLVASEYLDNADLGSGIWFHVAAPRRFGCRVSVRLEYSTQPR